MLTSRVLKGYYKMIIVILVVIIYIACIYNAGSACKKKFGDSRLALTKENYDKHIEDFFEAYKMVGISKKSEAYLKEFETSMQYSNLKSLYRELSLKYNQYQALVVNQTLPPKNPSLSPNTAGYIGTIVGGTGTGAAAAIGAEAKKQSYEQSMKLYHKSQIDKYTARNAALRTYSAIEKIINEREKTRLDWENEKKIIRKNAEDKTAELFRIKK